MKSIRQGVDAAMEDRALRGRNSSADAALQTAGVAAYGLAPAGTGPGPVGNIVKKIEHYVSVFSGEVQ